MACVVVCILVFGFWPGRPAGAQDSPRGDLKIEGTHISKVFLYGGEEDSHIEELTDPCGTVKIPVGTYSVQRVELRGGYVSAAHALGELKKIAVTEDTPDSLKVGGPLRQKVRATRQGRMVILRHELLGIGGERYLDDSEEKPPRFTMYKGDKVIASGQFAYG